jgi:PIN domain nuclease of toxin-antitoxin system
VTYLLDTAPFLWAATAPAKLTPKVRRLLENRRHTLAVSAASLWEVVIKSEKGMLAIPDAPQWLAAALRSLDAEVLPIRAPHVYAVHRLPTIHRDPFDRIILAQATVEGWPLITGDDAVRSYPVPTVW